MITLFQATITGSQDYHLQSKGSALLNRRNSTTLLHTSHTSHQGWTCVYFLLHKDYTFHNLLLEAEMDESKRYTKIDFYC